MTKIIKFNNDKTLKEELKQRIDINVKEYISIIDEYGLKLYGEDYFQIKEYHDLVADIYREALTNALKNLWK